MFERAKLKEIPLDPIAAEVIRSLKEVPDAWEGNEYELRHRESGVSVWIGNEDYGIDVSGYKPSDQSRRAIRKAYGEWLVSRLRTRDSDSGKEAK